MKRWTLLHLVHRVSQDLSVAGKQAGIHEGARSSLFFEAVRIIKEMREKDIADGRTDQFIRPRFAVWENVPGAFSSNKGQDFQAVLQALCSIRGGQSHIVPLPPKGKWLPAGNIVGNGFSLAWRVLDAAGWGVPQRRKRIFLVADFAGERAAEILFDENRLHGHSSPGGEAGQGTAAHAERSAGRSSGGGTESILVRIYDARGNGDGKAIPTLTGDHENRITDYTALCVERKVDE